MVTIFDQLIAMFAYTEFVINGVYVWVKDYEDTEKTKFPHGRNGHVAVLLLSGKYMYEVNGRRFTVPEGNFIFVPDKCVYSVRGYRVGNKPFQAICLHFDTPSPLPCPKEVYYHEASSQITELMLTIANIFQQTPVRHTRLREKVYRLFSLLSSDVSSIRCEVFPALEFIKQHFCENHPVGEYAKLCLMSESYFRKKFKQYTGLSPLEYRNQLRVEEAKRLYQNKLPIHVISEKVGFEDPGYLTKIYKKYKGVSLKDDFDIV